MFDTNNFNIYIRNDEMQFENFVILNSKVFVKLISVMPLF